MRYFYTGHIHKHGSILGFVIFFLASEACKVLLTNGFLQQQAIFVMCKVSCVVDINGFHIKS